MSAPSAAPRSALVADCANCAGLCCVALAFARSADFAFDKPAGEECRHLADDFRCRIHADLRPRGFTGCTVFDCFGAGQKVTQQTFGGRSWREDPGIRDMFAVFPVMRQLHELLWHLTEALALPAAVALAPELSAVRDRVERLTASSPAEILAADIPARRREVGDLLGRASAAARAGRTAPTGGGGTAPSGRGRRAASGTRRRVGPGADLLGAVLTGRDLRGADLRGALLVAADLRDADLRDADLLGADLRDADLRGADLSTAIFLSRPQLESAAGDRRTHIPERLGRPAHWG